MRFLLILVLNSVFIFRNSSKQNSTIMFHETACGANLFKFFSHNLIQRIKVKIKIKIIIKIKKYITAFCNGVCVSHLKFIIKVILWRAC